MSNSRTKEPTCLPEDTFAVLVHKLYQDRVRDFVLNRPVNMPDWQTAFSCSNPSIGTKRKLTLNADEEQQDTRPPKGGRETQPESNRCVLLDTTELTGVSRARRGYVLLLLQQTVRPCTQLPPMARQNVSWVARISHQMKINDMTTSDVMGQHLWTTLSENGFGSFPQQGDQDNQQLQQALRIDVHPREYLEPLCLQLQEACATCENSNSHRSSSVSVEGPFDGPVAMTMSASKCSHRLYVIFLKEPEQSSASFQVYWGLESRDKHKASMMIRLNQEASRELEVRICNHKTGAEQKQSRSGPVVTDDAPLSRAYYKLEQVWHDYLSSERERLCLDQGAGLDLGASPGGWTQVLVHLAQLPKVVAVDPAALADRVRKLSHVTHLATTLENANLQAHGPYSMVVCDASELYMELFRKMKTLTGKPPCWTLPSVWVVTMKLPFKSIGSVQRHVNIIEESAGSHLREMALAMFPKENIRIAYRVIHAMANSDSERTLIAVFEKA